MTQGLQFVPLCCCVTAVPTGGVLGTAAVRSNHIAAVVLARDADQYAAGATILLVYKVACAEPTIKQILEDGSIVCYIGRVIAAVALVTAVI